VVRSLQPLLLGDRMALSADLLAWFAVNRRDLPWRGEGDLYGTWVSEIMLQQTTVQAVIPYWRRFMREFPSIVELARADEAAVLSLWSGLGYYSRARNLHRAARWICAEQDGVLPDRYEEWLSLPGVGTYAAGAIASIGCGEAVPALDANARRVLLRWATTDPEALARLAKSHRRRLVDALGAELVPKESPGTWNEALMELGALVCGARRPDCENCPVAKYCSAWLGGWVESVPPVVSTASTRPA